MLNKDILYKDDNVQMKLDKEYYDVGKIKNIEVVSKDDHSLFSIKTELKQITHIKLIM